MPPFPACNPTAHGQRQWRWSWVLWKIFHGDLFAIDSMMAAVASHPQNTTDDKKTQVTILTRPNAVCIIVALAIFASLFGARLFN